MAIHAFIKGMFCFAYVLFAALGAFAVCFTDAPEDDFGEFQGGLLKISRFITADQVC